MPSFDAVTLCAASDHIHSESITCFCSHCSIICLTGSNRPTIISVFSGPLTPQPSKGGFPLMSFLRTPSHGENKKRSPTVTHQPFCLEDVSLWPEYKGCHFYGGRSFPLRDLSQATSSVPPASLLALQDF